jgi:hypothetical protein
MDRKSAPDLREFGRPGSPTRSCLSYSASCSRRAEIIRSSLLEIESQQRVLFGRTTPTLSALDRQNSEYGGTRHNLILCCEFGVLRLVLRNRFITDLSLTRYGSVRLPRRTGDVYRNAEACFPLTRTVPFQN